MEFENTFTVAAPLEEVWEAMLDLERVAPCVPGASVLERTGDNSYKVAIKVKLGPVSMTYKGDVEIVERDDAAHRATMRAKAQELRGQGTADATVEMRLEAADEGTRGTIHSSVAISGKAAAMGQGVIADVSARLIDQFAENLAAMLSGPAPEAVQAGAATAQAADTAPPETEAGTPPPPAPEPEAQAAPASDEGLPILSVLGSVLGERLKQPRVAVAVGAAIAALLFLLGRRSAR